MPSGRAAPYPDPDSVSPLTDEQCELVADCTARQFVENADEGAQRLADSQRVTYADEPVITSVAHRHENRMRSHELVAMAWTGS